MRYMGKPTDIIIAVLILIPLVALLLIPTYNSENPIILGLPFFYFYQLLWMPVAALLFYIAAVLWNRRDRKNAGRGMRRKMKRSNK